MAYHPNAVIDQLAEFKTQLLKATDIPFSASTPFCLCKAQQDVKFTFNRMVKEKVCSRKVLKAIMKVAAANSTQLTLEPTFLEKLYDKFFKDPTK